MPHAFSQVLQRIALGEFPPVDGVVEVLAPLQGKADVLFGLTGHWVLAAEIDEMQLMAQLPPGDFSAPMSAATVAWIALQLGTTAGPFDAVFVGIASGDASGVDSIGLERVEDLEHPRVRRAMRYRDDVRVYATTDGAGVVVLGRGVTRRWELAFEVDESQRSLGLGRSLVRASLGLLPAGTPLWAQVSPGNAASMRTMIASGFRPVGAEILFPKSDTS